MTWLAALAAGLAFLLYLRSPIDLIPDRIGPLGLLDDLIVLIAVIVWVRRHLGRATPRGRGSSDDSREDPRRAEADPYSVLGVARDASPEEISRAYREQMKHYHPDRVAGLGEDLQRLAHHKTLEIQRAYASLGKR